MQSSSPRCYPHCFPVCFRDELYCCHRKWMLDYRHGSSGSKRSCRKKKGSSRMLLNPKGLYCRTPDQVNKKQLLSPPAWLWLSFLSPRCVIPARRKPLCSLSVFRAKEDGHQEEQAVRSLPGSAGTVPSPQLHYGSAESCSGVLTPSFAGHRTGPTFLLCRREKRGNSFPGFSHTLKPLTAHTQFRPHAVTH